MGGLGHMGVKFARALGAHVVLFTTSECKTADALRLGAHEVVVSRDNAEMQKHAASLDFILNTVSAEHDLNSYRSPEARRDHGDAGCSGESAALGTVGLLFSRRRLAGSLIGGIRETQEMLDFCAERGITADIELIRIQQINDPTSGC